MTEVNASSSLVVSVHKPVEGTNRQGPVLAVKKWCAEAVTFVKKIGGMRSAISERQKSTQLEDIGNPRDKKGNPPVSGVPMEEHIFSTSGIIRICLARPDLGNTSHDLLESTEDAKSDLNQNYEKQLRPYREAVSVNGGEINGSFSNRPSKIELIIDTDRKLGQLVDKVFATSPNKLAEKLKESNSESPMSRSKSEEGNGELPALRPNSMFLEAYNGVDSPYKTQAPLLKKADTAILDELEDKDPFPDYSETPPVTSSYIDNINNNIDDLV